MLEPGDFHVSGFGTVKVDRIVAEIAKHELYFYMNGTREAVVPKDRWEEDSGLKQQIASFLEASGMDPPILANWLLDEKFRLKVYGEFQQCLFPRVLFMDLEKMDAGNKEAVRECMIKVLRSTSAREFQETIDIIERALRIFNATHPVNIEFNFAERSARWPKVFPRRTNVIRSKPLRKNAISPRTEMLQLVEHLIDIAPSSEDPQSKEDNATMHSILQLLRSLMHILDKKHGETVDEYSLESVIAGVTPKEVKEVYETIKNHIDTNALVSDKRPYNVWKEYVNQASLAFEWIKDSIRKFPRAFTVGEINDLYMSRKTSEQRNGFPTFKVVVGVDAKLLPASQLAKNAVLQVASQFNFLESKTPDYMAITEYYNDATQGPQASMGSLAALIVRDAGFREKDPQTIFETVKDAGVYKGGYLMPTKLESPEQKSALLTHLRTNIKDLRILAQWGLPELGASPLLQVFTAAPSFQEEKGDDEAVREALKPEQGSTDEQICTLLVTFQYRAVAQIAALRSSAVARIPLHLTLVGQGAFNNPGCAMKSALQAVHDAVKGFNVDVYIHCFNMDNDVINLRMNLPYDLNGLWTSLDRENGKYLVPDSYLTADQFMEGGK